MQIADASLEHIQTSVHGRYWVRSAGPEADRPTLVGFHGYGESATDHLREINLIPGLTAWNLVAIQALHPFYKNRTGDVVASWMTKMDREEAIEDNLRYVTAVLDREVRRRSGTARPPLVFIGFSQGTAMAYRAAAHTGSECDAVVALGGDVPPELSSGALAELPVALLGRGSRDEWYTEEKLSQDLEMLAGQGVDCRPIRYAGGHEWTDGFRAAVGRFLEGLLQTD